MRQRPFAFAALLAASASFVAPARAEETATVASPPAASCEVERAAWTKEAQLPSATALADCELKAQRFAEAARVIAPFVGAAGGTTRERARVTQISDAARSHVLTVKIEIDVLDAEVLVDGQSVGRSPIAEPLFLAPGSHTITVTHEGRAPVQQVVAGDAGVMTSATIRIVPLRHDYFGYDVPSTQPGPPYTGKSVPIIVAGSVAAGVAFAIGATYTVLTVTQGSTVSDRQQAIVASGGSKTSCASPTPGFVAECAALQDSLTKRDSLANTAVASFLIGGALVGATLLYAYWPTSKRRDRWEPTIAGAHVRPEPLIGPGVGGLVLKGSF